MESFIHSHAHASGDRPEKIGRGLRISIREGTGVIWRKLSRIWERSRLDRPIERGDDVTFLAHLEDLRSLPDPVRRLFCSAGELIVQMASLRGLQHAKAAEIQRNFEDGPMTGIPKKVCVPDLARMKGEASESLC
jgi:hypothetical protein